MLAEVTKVTTKEVGNRTHVHILLEPWIDGARVNLSEKFYVSDNDDIPYRGDKLEVQNGGWGWELVEKSWMEQ